MRPRVPEGPRFLRSDGTPDKATRIHKEHKWYNEVIEPEFLHAPSSPLRPAVIEILSRNISNVIVAEGDKYQGVVRLPKLASSLALWREREVPIYKLLLEPLKRFEEGIPAITEDSPDKEVASLLNANPCIDEYPVVSSEGKVVAILPIREIIAKYVPQMSTVTLKEVVDDEVPVVGSVGEALMIMRDKEVPVVYVEDKVLDARDVLKTIWENRRLNIGEVSYESVLKEANVFKGDVSLKDVLSELDVMKVDYILVEDGNKVKYVPLGRIASRIFHG